MWISLRWEVSAGLENWPRLMIGIRLDRCPVKAWSWIRNTAPFRTSLRNPRFPRVLNWPLGSQVSAEFQSFRGKCPARCLIPAKANVLTPVLILWNRFRVGPSQNPSFLSLARSIPSVQGHLWDAPHVPWDLEEKSPRCNWTWSGIILKTYRKLQTRAPPYSQFLPK